MYEAFDYHERVSIGGRLITNIFYRFVDDIVANAEEEEEADNQVDCLDTISTMYKLEIGTNNTKEMANSPNGFRIEIKINGLRLEAVENFRYLGSLIVMNDPNPRFFQGLPRQQQLFLRI